MNGRKVLKTQELSEDEVQRREIFLSTYYIDAKDTFKQLFTLNSAVLIFYATYAKDKIKAASESISGHNFGVATYVVFSLSMLSCVVGFYLLQLAAEKATNLRLWGYRWSLGRFYNYSGFALLANWCLEFAGVMFLFGVLLIGKVLLY